MAITAGRVAAGRQQGAGTVAKSLHSDLHAERPGLLWSFETSKPTPSDIPPPIRPYLLILLKQFY